MWAKPGKPPDSIKTALNPARQIAKAQWGEMVSAAGFEPATHALKGRCSTN